MPWSEVVMRRVFREATPWFVDCGDAGCPLTIRAGARGIRLRDGLVIYDRTAHFFVLDLVGLP
jgi:hypothetical protein